LTKVILKGTHAQSMKKGTGQGMKERPGVSVPPPGAPPSQHFYMFSHTGKHSELLPFGILWRLPYIDMIH
jgi:hypothetical protein